MVDRITAFLDSHGVSYRCVHHEPTRTSEESAKARGEPLEVGGKAIVMKVGEEFMLFVFSAARRIDSQKIKAHFGVKKIRFASAEELHQLTGLVPGSVPPFGKPLLPFELFVDTSISLNDRIAFNAGSLTDSIVMNSADYLRFANGVTFTFAE
jgi:prolyl-tRNA editing enzyme YbaK/EbsC (Cys-tRNA(Pro) deacylase)